MNRSSSMIPRSNSIGLWLGMLLGISVIAVGILTDYHGEQRFAWRSGLIGFSLVPLCIAAAELRSGYAWKNLASGNRGVSRAEQPRRFWLSVGAHAALALGLAAYGILGVPACPGSPNQRSGVDAGRGFLFAFQRQWPDTTHRESWARTKS